MDMDDLDYMKMALELAEKGRGFTSPNPMVGAVIVKEGRIVGRGYHQAAGKAHAEVNAINDAGTSVRGATLYVTLEPCNHTGRTPPCTEKIIRAGISKVVVAMKDPNPDVKGGGIDYLRNHGITVETGVHERPAEKQNEGFIKYIKTKRPFVIVKCAATLDGRIATKTGDSKWVSGDASRRYVHQLRHACDAIMVGINTVIADDPSLTARLENSGTKDPIRLILDTRLRISEQAKVLHLASEAKTIIVTGFASSKEKKRRLRNNGIEILEMPLKSEGIDLNLLMNQLGAMEMTSVLVEGGARVISGAIRSKIVDRINFFFAPKLLCSDDGVPICTGSGPELMSSAVAVKDIRIERFENDIMIEGYIDN